MAQAIRLKLRTLDTSFVIAAMVCGAATASFAFFLCDSGLPGWWNLLHTSSYQTVLEYRLFIEGSNAQAFLSDVVTDCGSALSEEKTDSFCEITETMSIQPSSYRL